MNDHVYWYSFFRLVTESTGKLDLGPTKSDLTVDAMNTKMDVELRCQTRVARGGINI